MALLNEGILDLGTDLMEWILGTFLNVHILIEGKYGYTLGTFLIGKSTNLRNILYLLYTVRNFP